MASSSQSFSLLLKVVSTKSFGDLDDFLASRAIFGLSQRSCYRKVSEGGHFVTPWTRLTVKSFSLHLTHYNQFVKVIWLSSSNMTKYYIILWEHIVENLSMILSCSSRIDLTFQHSMVCGVIFRNTSTRLFMAIVKIYKQRSYVCNKLHFILYSTMMLTSIQHCSHKYYNL